MVRDRETGKSKGFAFLKYDDQRSTVLAVDNFNGTSLLGRTLRVDHSREYRQPKKKRRRDDKESESEESEVELDEEGKPRVKGFNVAPKGWLDPPVEETSEEEEEDLGEGIDVDDPMREYLIEKRREERASGKEKKAGSKRIKEEEGDKKRRHRHRHRSTKDGEERQRRSRHTSHRPRIEGESKRDGREDLKSRHRQDRDDTPETRRDRDDTPETRPHRNNEDDHGRRTHDDRGGRHRSSSNDKREKARFRDEDTERGNGERSRSPRRT
jgi:RNA-binding motif X-linked protein 2